MQEEDGGRGLGSAKVLLGVLLAGLIVISVVVIRSQGRYDKARDLLSKHECEAGAHLGRFSDFLPYDLPFASLVLFDRGEECLALGQLLISPLQSLPAPTAPLSLGSVLPRLLQNRHSACPRMLSAKNDMQVRPVAHTLYQCFFTLPSVLDGKLCNSVRLTKLLLH